MHPRHWFLLLTLCLPASTAVAANDTQRTDLSSAAGIAWEFQPNGGAWQPMKVPAGGWRTQGLTCDAGIYRATFPIPAFARGRVVRVAFAAVNFGAEVLAGPDPDHLTAVARHLNGWMPFNADITPYAQPGKPLTLEVRVSGRRLYMKDGKYLVPEGATWYPGLAEGILRGVTLEVLPAVHADSVFVKTSVSNDTVEPIVTVTNDSAATARIVVSAKLVSAGGGRFRYPALPAATLELSPGETRSVSLGTQPWRLGAASYWWPNVPYRADYRAQLHRIDVDVRAAGSAHHLSQRFGFRQFEARGNRYYLNGVCCNLRGDNQQEANFQTDAYGIKAGFGPPTAANPGWPRAVDNLLQLNFNVLRIHQIPATPYMLDVCDEKGLMLVEESPIRNSEGQEDMAAGRVNMVNMDRELALRDRNHPATVLWSEANETSDRELLLACRDAMLEVDDTRPIIADGIDDPGAPILNMEHYTTGFSGPPTRGAKPRADRPYGETESVWPNDNTWQGFAWMSTATRLRRLKGNADIRNYIIGNAFPNYVPGEGPETQVLEKRVKNMGGDMTFHEALADPWNHPLVKLMQQSFSPVAVWDTAFDERNLRSNARGDWPTVKPKLKTGAPVTRSLAVLNDDLAGDLVQVAWELRAGASTGARITAGEFDARVPPGGMTTQEIAFTAPATPGDVALVVWARKDGKERYREEKMVFAVTDDAEAVRDGAYQLRSRLSGLPAEVARADAGARLLQGAQAASGTRIWSLRHLTAHEVVLTAGGTDLALSAETDEVADGAPVALAPADGSARQIWRLTATDDGGYTLTNKATGKVLDLYRQRTDPGADIVLYGANAGANQIWEFTPAPEP